MTTRGGAEPLMSFPVLGVWWDRWLVQTWGQAVSCHHDLSCTLGLSHLGTGDAIPVCDSEELTM